MLTHGAGKMKMLFRGEFEGFPDPLGLGSTVSLIGAASSEFVFALLVVAGVGTRIVAIPPAVTMLVAATIVHGGQPIGNMELALLYLAMFVTLIFTGGGRFSVDELLARRKAAKKK